MPGCPWWFIFAFGRPRNNSFCPCWTYMLGALDFKGIGILGAQLHFLEHSLAKGPYHTILIFLEQFCPREKGAMRLSLLWSTNPRATLGVVTARVRYVPSGSLTSHRINCEELWDGTFGLSSLSEKNRKSNHFQISLQRQHFVLSYFKTPSVGPALAWTHGLPHGSLALYQLSQPVCDTHGFIGQHI